MSSIVGEEYTNIVEGVKFFEVDYVTTDERIHELVYKSRDRDIWPEVAGKAFGELQKIDGLKMGQIVFVCLLESYMEVCDGFDLALD